MRRWALILAMAAASMAAYGQSGNLVPQAAYCMYATTWIPVASSSGQMAPESYPQVALYGQSGTTWYPLACDSGGHIISGPIGSDTQIAFNKAGTESGDPDLTWNATSELLTVSGAGAAISTLTLTNPLAIAYQVTNPSMVLHVNSASVYSGTPDGTAQKPFTTFASAFAAMTSALSYGISCDDGQTHVETISTGPSAPTSITLFGNQCTLNDSTALTFSQPIYDYGLGFTGTVNGAAGSVPSVIEGVVFNGVINVGGTLSILQSEFVNSSTINAGAGSILYIVQSIINGHLVAGSGATLLLDNVQMNSGGFSSNVNWNSGGTLAILDGAILVDGGISPNVACSNGATSSAPNIIGDSVRMNVGIACGSAYTAVSPTAQIPSFTGGTNTYYAGLNGTLPASFTNLAASGSVTFTGIEGASTYCLQISSAGVVSNTGSACGVSSSALSGMTSGQLAIAGSVSTITSSIAYATAATASTVVERDSSDNINTGLLTLSGTIAGSAQAAGILDYGTQAFSDTGKVEAYQASVNGYIYNAIQNTNTGGSASACYLVANSNTTQTTNYGKFCMDGSGFTGTGSLNQSNTVTFDSYSADVAIGTYTANALHFVYDNGSTDSMTINGSGVTVPIGQIIDSANGAASTSPFYMTGSVFTGGSGTTTFPYMYYNAGSGVSTFSTAGTVLGMNAVSGFTGNFADYHLNGGSSVYSVDYLGDVIGGGHITGAGLSAIPGANASSGTVYGTTMDLNTLGGYSHSYFSLNATPRQNDTAPTSSDGSLVGTTSGGYISGLSGSTTVTITFATSRFATWASCEASTSVAGIQPYVSSISSSSVTFTMTALTGTLYYHCDGD